MALQKKEPRDNRYNVSFVKSEDKAIKKLMKKYNIGRSELLGNLALQAEKNDK